MMQDRLKAISGEAGVSSRWNLLPELNKGIMKHLLFGSGFGSTITYKSEDPRILETNPSGMYTTYAFEWGYLDTIYKIGILGLLAYLILIWKIFQAGYIAIKNQTKQNIRNLLLGMILGLIVLLITHVFSPYLNHPLGIGYIIICACIFEYFAKEASIDKSKITA